MDFHPKRVMTATMPGATFRSVVYAFGPPRLELSGRQYAGRNSDGRPGVAILRRLGEAGHAKLGDRSYLVRRGDDDPDRHLPGSRRAGGANDNFYLATREYLFQFDITTWGWIHLILGIVVALAGVGLLAGRTWARVVGITLAVLSAIANFTFIPHYPLWALLVIALDVFVIWALAAHGRELRGASA